MKKSILFSFGLFIFLSTFTTSCTRNKVLAKVGESKITQKDVDFRMKVMKGFNQNLNPDMALNQLIHSYTLLEVLKLRKINIGDEEVNKEWDMRKSMFEKDPRMAAVLKEAGGNVDELKRVMILPMLVERTMFGQGYQQDTEFHHAEKDKAQKIFDAVKANPSKFDELVAKEGGIAVSGVIDEKTGLKWKEDKKLPPGVAFQGPGVGVMLKKKYLEKTAPGSLVPELVDERMAYMVLLHEKGSNPKGTISLRAGIVPKKNFGDWMKEQQSKVKVEKM